MIKYKDYCLTVCEEGIVISNGYRVSFYSWYDLDRIDEVEEVEQFLKTIN